MNDKTLTGQPAENFTDDVAAEQLPPMLQLSLEEMEQFANQGIDPSTIAAFHAKPGVIKVIEQKNGLVIFNALFVFHKDAFKGASRLVALPSTGEDGGFETARAKDIHKALMGSKVRFYLQKEVFNLAHWNAVAKGEPVAGPTARVIRGN